ncbi:transposable element Tcb2 transposase [Trichonephila clavipes]|nr:transposable element Tcb2 transposase [Trichonephila clavipes]
MPLTDQSCRRPQHRNKCTRRAICFIGHHLGVEWCRARGISTAAEWNQVVFSDQSRLNLRSDGNRIRLWRPRGESLDPAFALQRHTTPTAGVIFQEDNARPHTARVSQDCLRTITTLVWPDRSPDLSGIEHIWDHLGLRVGHPTSLNELEARNDELDWVVVAGQLRVSFDEDVIELTRNSEVDGGR